MNGNRDLLLLQKVMNEPIYDNQCPEYIISIFNRANCEIGELRYLFSASKGKPFFFQCIVLINSKRRWKLSKLFVYTDMIIWQIILLKLRKAGTSLASLQLC